MKIRIKYGLTGTFHGIDGLGYGSVVDIDRSDAERYIRQGMAEEVVDEPAAEEHALKPSDAVEFAVPSATRGRGRSPKNV